MASTKRVVTVDADSDLARLLDGWAMRRLS